jgi:PIN domain nuclease of toxin-antitoxin system
VNLLLDTHAVQWWLSDDPTLSETARTAVSDPENTVYLSALVVWEMRIKQGIGKLDLPDDFEEVLDSQAFSKLPVTVDHAHAIAELPGVHRETPFEAGRRHRHRCRLSPCPERRCRRDTQRRHRHPLRSALR